MADLPSQPAPNKIRGALRTIVRARLTAGILTVIPIWLTYAVVVFVFNLMRSATEPLARLALSAWVESTSQPGVPAPLRGYTDWIAPILAVLLTTFILYLLGLFTANVLGRRVLAALETAVDRLPIVKTVYRSTKQVLDAFRGKEGQAPQRVVLIEFPHAGMRSVGFLTATLTEQRSGGRVYNVFVPCAPFPSTGFLIAVPAERVYETDWTVEQAFRMIMSGGVLAMPTLTFSGLSPAAPAAPSAVEQTPAVATYPQAR